MQSQGSPLLSISFVYVTSGRAPLLAFHHEPQRVLNEEYEYPMDSLLWTSSGISSPTTTSPRGSSGSQRYLSLYSDIIGHIDQFETRLNDPYGFQRRGRSHRSHARGGFNEYLDDLESKIMVHGISEEYFARLHYPKLRLCNVELDFSIDNTRFISLPTLLGSPESSVDDKVGWISFFNIIFTLDRFGTAMNPSSILMCSQMVKALSGALRHEQVRCNYISKQILPLDTPRSRTSPERSISEELSGILVSVFDAIQRKQMISIQVNGWLQLSTPPAIDQIPYRGLSSILPYDTFLPFEDTPYKLLASLPPGSAEAVQLFLKHANPFRSFQDLHMDLDIPLAALLRMAGRLVDWQLGCIVETVSKHSIYVVNSEADLDCESRRADEFKGFAAEVLTNNWRLLDLLQRFSMPRSLGYHLNEVERQGRSTAEFKACVLWLLRSRLLVQTKTFVMVSLPESQTVGEYLVARGVEEPEFSRIVHLAEFLDGEHHLEDVMWREGISRTQLEGILSRFSDMVTWAFL